MALKDYDNDIQRLKKINTEEAIKVSRNMKLSGVQQRVKNDIHCPKNTAAQYSLNKLEPSNTFISLTKHTN